MSKALKYAPIVYAAGREYQIVAAVEVECVMWVRVGEREYYDHFCGVVRSASDMHKMTVPMEELDNARAYTICYRVVTERRAYRSEVYEVLEESFDFCPANGEDLRTYHISDTHNKPEKAIAAAKHFMSRSGLDFLILNGDIPADNQKQSSFETIFKICDQLTHGEIPVIFSRGNHDLRGAYAEKTAIATPIVNGATYFTFKLGNVWGMVLDCGEDKPDTHVEYMNMVACHGFREAETEFIKNVIENAQNEYLSPNIRHKLVICHIPFTLNKPAPFNIEREMFGEWTRLLREEIRPDIILCGHTHDLTVFMAGNKCELHAQPCDLLCGSLSRLWEHEGGEYFAGTGMTFTDDGIKYEFVDSDGRSVEPKIVE